MLVECLLLVVKVCCFKGLFVCLDVGSVVLFLTLTGGLFESFGRFFDVLMYVMGLRDIPGDGTACECFETVSEHEVDNLLGSAASVSSDLSCNRAVFLLVSVPTFRGRSNSKTLLSLLPNDTSWLDPR